MQSRRPRRFTQSRPDRPRRRLKQSPTPAVPDSNPTEPALTEGPADQPRRAQWPFFLLLLIPWLAFTAALIFQHSGACLLCNWGQSVVQYPGQ